MTDMNESLLRKIASWPCGGPDPERCCCSNCIARYAVERIDAARHRIDHLERAIHTIHEEADDNEDGAIDAHYAAKAMTRVKATCIDVMPDGAFEEGQ